MTERVVIVGAGPGGLASAMLLARAGLDVTVLERRPEIGGRTALMHDAGFTFDRGPTFFLYPRVLEEIFSACGRSLREDVPMIRLDPQYRLEFGAGGRIDATPDLERLAAEVARLEPGDAAGVARYMEENRAKLAAFRPILESPFGSALDLMRPEYLKALPLLRPLASVDDDLKRYFRDPRVRLAFSFQSKYLGMSPYRCPSLFTILAFLEYEHGVHHPVGGCGRVSEVMAEAAVELGAKILTEHEVEHIDFDGRRVRAVEAGGERFEADAIVINADFARAMQRLVPDHLRSRWSDRKIARKRFSCSTWMLYLGIDGVEDLPHHTIYISSDYEGNLRDIESGERVSEDPSFYVQNACVTDPSLAPPGCSTLYVLVPVGNLEGGLDWSVESPKLRAKILDHLGKIGCSDLRGRIRSERIITPADWDQDHQIHLGATFNLAHSLDQMLHWRPGNRFRDLDGVYLVGGGTHPGSGLPVIYEGARISSGLLLSDLGRGPLPRPGETIRATPPLAVPGP